MRYPLNVRFKVVALTNQIYITDADGVELLYVKQKMFKLKENIEIYRDQSKSELLFTVKADRVIDFSPVLTLTDAGGKVLGSVKRQGRRSLWRANYDISLGEAPFAHVREASVWNRFGNAVFGELPFIGLLAGYVFHPKYLVSSTDGILLATIKKLPAMFEGKFSLEPEDSLKLNGNQELHFVALLMTVALFERTRG